MSLNIDLQEFVENPPIAASTGLNTLENALANVMYNSQEFPRIDNRQ